MGGDTVIAAVSQDESDRSNSENVNLYPVHPFRLYGTGKANLKLAQDTFRHRRSPFNDGWCQDVVDAAMLNLTSDAIEMVVQRAKAKSKFRWPGFAAHYQDYEPSSDHFDFQRVAMHYMLLSPLDDEAQSVVIFPTWPTSWDVEFKLHAPLRTIIEARCVNGVLEKLVVTPQEREKDVYLGNCARPGAEKTT